MEVHHHPHVEKKNFKEYFLEFIWHCLKTAANEGNIPQVG